MKINDIAKGQYKQLCKLSWEKCKGDEQLLEYKIKRAVDLGKESYQYQNGSRIVRYHYLNFLIHDDEIMTIWKDKVNSQINVSENIKALHRDVFHTRKNEYEELFSTIKQKYNK